MKKFMLGAASAFLLCSLVLFLTTAVSASDGAKKEEQESDIWIVRETSGRLGVFAEGKSEPSRVLDVSVEGLPDADRLLLENGITATGYRELCAILEDYTS